MCNDEVDVLALTETFFNGRSVDIPGYKCVVHDDRKDTEGGAWGGAAIYVKEDLQDMTRQVLMKKPRRKSDGEEPNVQVCSVEILGRIISVLYRPPSQSNEDYELMSKLLNINFEDKEAVILTGDYNMPGVDWEEGTCKNDPQQELLMHTISKLGLEQLVHVPTHVKGNTLDIVATSKATEIEELKITETFNELGHLCSDHFLITFNLNIKIRIEDIEKVIWMHDKADWSQFRWYLGRVPWNYIERDSSTVSILYDNYIGEINTVYSNCVPKKTIYPNRPRVRGSKIKNQVKKLKNCKRKKNWKAVRQEQKVLSDMIYKEKRRELVAHLRFLESSPANIYKAFKDYNKEDSGLGPVRDNNGFLQHGDKERAEILQNHFLSVFSPQTWADFDLDSTPVNAKAHIDEMTFTVEDVYKELKSLPPKTSAGVSGITNKMLKEGAYQLAWPLARLFYHSMRLYEVPHKAMDIKVCPIPKQSEDRASPASFRPIAMCCNVIKVMEGLFVKKLNEEFVKAGVFQPNQYGFTEGLGRDDKLIDQVEWLTGKLDSGIPCDAIYFDFSRAFDVIDHSRLIKRFNDYGVCGEPLRWLQAWLGTGCYTNMNRFRIPNRRQQFVQIGTERSASGLITSGILQGSKVGPFAFKIYINDLLEKLNGAEGPSRALCYADDLTILGTVAEEQQVQHLQELVNIASIWANQNKLVYNKKKIFVLHHESRTAKNVKNDYYLGDEAIQKTEFQKDLGVLIDSKLSMSKHNEKCAQKLNGATIKVMSILRSAPYCVRKFAWDKYLVPIALNGVLIARTFTKKTVELFNKAYRRIFSKCKPKTGSKIALPVEMHWAYIDLFWVDKLFKNGLKNFNVSQYLVPAQQQHQAQNELSKFGHENKFLMFHGNPYLARQRRPRAADQHHPHSRGHVQLGDPVVPSCRLSRRRAPVARCATTYDVIKRKQNDRLPFKEVIEREVFPSLQSFDIYKKLEKGQLLTQRDAYQKKMESLALSGVEDTTTL